MCMHLCLHVYVCMLALAILQACVGAYVARPGKSFIYIKYTCSYYGTYLLFCMCYPESISFIKFFIDVCIAIMMTL